MSISLPTSPPRPITTLFPYTTLFRSGLNRFEAWTRDDDWVNKWYVKSGFKNVDSYLQVFVDSDELVGIMKRSEEHTSELQSRGHLVCRLLLEKKNHTVRRRAAHNCGY